MLDSKEFFDIAKKSIGKVKDSQRVNIMEASKMMGDCMNKNGIVQLFGIDGGRAFSMELGYRAGGLMPFHQFNTKDLALRGVISEEKLNDEHFNDDVLMAHELWNLYNIDTSDMFILISNTGIEPLMVEVALIAKEKGHQVIAVINKKASDLLGAKHTSNKKLSDIADLILNVDVDVPDVIIEADTNIKINQVGTICGNVIAQMLTAETYRYLKEHNCECPVLLSANVKGADVHNREISDKYLNRWNS